MLAWQQPNSWDTTIMSENRERESMNLQLTTCIANLFATLWIFSTISSFNGVGESTFKVTIAASLPI